MGEKLPKILAVNPGSRYLGFAVFCGPDLQDWGIKTIRGSSPNEKLKAVDTILHAFIEQYGINVMALKALHTARSSVLLERLVASIKKLAERYDLKLFRYSLGTIRSFFSETQKVTKARMAEHISQKYPFLIHDLEKEKANLNPYHMRMFEAVALGQVCINRFGK